MDIFRSSEKRSDSGGSLLLVWLITTMLLWLLAFYSLPSDTPEWVRRTQAVCFGTNESGLPSSAGWIVLIGGPLSFLAAIAIALPEDLRRIQMLLSSSRKFRVFAFLLASLTVVEGSWVTTSIAQKLNRSPGELTDVILSQLPPDYPQTVEPAPDFELIDQTGTLRSLSSLRGRPVLVSFVFSHCSSVCPVLTKLLLRTQREIKEARVVVMLITLDPWRDTPSSLPSLAEQWKLPEDTYLLSGEPEKVNAVLQSFHVSTQRDEKTGEIVHPALVHVISPSGAASFVFNSPSEQWLHEAVLRVGK